MATFTYTGGNLTASAGTTGTGLAVGQTSPALVTPSIGAATGTSLSTTGAIISTLGYLASGSAAGGVVGNIAMYSTTASRGTLQFLCQNNASAYNILVQNASYGQSSTLTIPDVGSATANFALSPAALVSGNLIQASGTAGLVQDSGISSASITASQLNPVGITVTGYTSVPFTTNPQTIWSVSPTYIFASDGGVVNGLAWISGQTGTVTAYTAVDFGNCVSVLWTSTWSNVTSVTGNSVLNFGGTGLSNTGPALTSLTMPNVKYVLAGSFSPNWAVLTTMSMPALKIIATTFNPTLALCTTLTLTALATIGTSVAISAAVLTTLSLPGLLRVGTTFTITAASMTTFSMNAGLLQIGGNFTMTGMALNQASVDGILVSLAALDGTGGTTAYSGFTVNLSGGTSSAPSATGIAAGVTLTGRGCTVITN